MAHVYRKSIALKNLKTDMSYQRSLLAPHVSKIAKDFDPRALGSIVVSERNKGGDYFIIDGQHRVAALRSLNREEVEIDCVVHVGLTVSEEAALFLLLDTVRNPTGFAKFHARVAQGEFVAIAIVGILAGVGLRYGSTKSSGAVCAVSTMEKIYRQSPAILRLTIETLHRAFSGNTDSYDNILLKSVADFFTKHKGADPARLAHALSGHSLTTLIPELKARAKMKLAPADALLSVYNNGLRKGRIEAA